MTPGAVALALLAWLGAESGYAIPAEVPRIEIVSPAVLCERVVTTSEPEGPECRTLAFYRPWVIVLREDVVGDLRDPGARSVLLHELVHHLQWVSGWWAGDWAACDTRLLLERQALLLQQRWLVQQGRQPGDPGLGGWLLRRDSVRLKPGLDVHCAPEAASRSPR